MYNDYFGLNQAPFKITPDTSLFFPGGNRGAVLDALIYAITTGEGIVKVVGEVGTGKTMLCRMLEVELPDNVEIVYLANPSLSPDDILHAIAFELKLDLDLKEDRLKVMNKLQHYLLEKHAINHQVVVFVEEAQSMPIATLEEIRLLSNLETNQNKLLQIVLFGQPELDLMIAKKEIRQLKERITYSFNLTPLKQDEIRDYLNSRLRSCGYRAGELFSPSAIEDIFRFSRGLLRRINILADKSLLAAYASNNNTISYKHVRQAARDSEFVSDYQILRPMLATAAIIVVSVILTVWFLSTSNINISFSDNQGRTLNQEHNVNFDDISRNQDQIKVKTEESVETIYHIQDHTHYYDYLSLGNELMLYNLDQSWITPGLMTGDIDNILIS